MDVDHGVEHGVGELLGLLGDVADRIEALGNEPGTVDASVVSGSSPQAAENRSVRAARARLAQDRARRMGERLEVIRAEARRMAGYARDVSASRPRPAADPGPGDAGPAFADADDRAGVLAVLVRHVLVSVPGATRAVVCAPGPTAVPVPEGPDDGLVAALVAAQRLDRGGPLAEVGAGAPVVRVPDVREETRWPELARRVEALGVRGLFVRGLPGPRSHALALVVGGAAGVAAEPADTAVARLAAQAEIALAGVARCEGLRRGLASRDLIGQAKGILMQRDGVDADDAFALLVAASQDSNIKLHDVAAWLIGDARR